MISRPPTPDPWLDALLQAEREAPGPDAELQARLWQRLQTSVALAESGGMASAPIGASVVTPATGAVVARGGAGAPQIGNLLGWIVGPVALGTLLVGALAHLPAATAPMEAAAIAGTRAQAATQDPFAAPDDRDPGAETTLTDGLPSQRSGADSGARPSAARPPAPQGAIADAPAREERHIVTPTTARAVKADGAVVPGFEAKARGPAASTGTARRRARAARRPATRGATRRPAVAAEDAPPSMASPAGGLREELRLVRAARAAIAHGQAGRALTTLKDHATRFPGGQLREEREALYVVALARRGDHHEASAAARVFLRRYPSSMQTGIVRAALRRRP